MLVWGQVVMLSRKGQDALLILGGTGFENKHAAVPKPFHILKRRQSTNLWIGRLGTPVTNVISAWHRGFKPIQPPTHRPLLRLCHHNPQAGFLLPRWAGDSICVSKTAMQGQQGEIIIYSWHDNRGLDSQSVVILYVHIWGLGRCNSKGIRILWKIDYFFISDLTFYLYQWGCIWEEETNGKQMFFWVDW